IAERFSSLGLTTLGWRDVPVTSSLLGPTSAASEPWFVQQLVAADGAPNLGHRRRAQSLLHQRAAALGPGPAVSLHRPQWRDQHRAGQPQLDDGARDH